MHKNFPYEHNDKLKNYCKPGNNNNEIMENENENFYRSVCLISSIKWCTTLD